MSITLFACKATAYIKHLTPEVREENIEKKQRAEFLLQNFNVS
jgi:hypothetical protein